IVFVEPVDKLDNLMETYGFSDSSINYLKPSQFFIPGFIDTHIHAPQFPNNGLKLELPLLQWLEKYTFPSEARLSDVQFAKYLYPKVVDCLLRNGTTTASYFASLHLPATKVLADVAVAKGQRALVGKVSMLVNSPDNYKESSLEDSIRDNEEFIEYVKSLQSPLVQPIVTPRFAPTCPTEQLNALGQLAKKYNCHVQTHLSETRPEISWVKELFPWSKSYTDVYDKSGLLSSKTIMSHCIWIDEVEVETLRACNVGVSHCPNSNISIRSGLCDVRRLLRKGIKVGLGTDCSGGYSPSILDSIRHAVQTSNTLAILNEGYKHLSLFEAFRLATLGGAKVVDMDNCIGNFEISKEFDALLIDMEVPDTAVYIDENDTLEDRLQRYLLNGDDRHIVEVYVAGNKVHERSTTSKY
ncbi:hypothetical protein SK128_024331, partial [Halocaridina rubra]